MPWRPARAPRPQKVDDPTKNATADGVVEEVEKPLSSPSSPEHVPEVREREDPREAPEKCVEAELAKFILAVPAGKRKRAQDGQAAGDEDRELAYCVEPLLRDAEVMCLTPTTYRSGTTSPAAPQPDKVGDPNQPVPEDGRCHAAKSVIRPSETR